MDPLGVNESFWKGRRVLVTGHTGFKGAWLSLWLEKLGASVAGYSLAPPTQPSLFDLTGLADRVTHVLGDVTESDRVTEAVERIKPEVVFHLAAQSTVQTSYTQPIETIRTNVFGTAAVLEACRRSDSVRVVVNVTTDKVYKNFGDGRFYRETDELGGTDPYSVSKVCSEFVSQTWQSSLEGVGDRSLATARSTNVIAGGDWAPDRLVPDLVRAAGEGSLAQVRNPRAVRSWMHVLDCLSGYLVLAEALWSDTSASGAWNFGPASDGVATVQGIADRFASLWPNAPGWQAVETKLPQEMPDLRLDWSKARRDLGWEPRVPLDLALRWTVDWYRQGPSGALERCRDQIDEWTQRSLDSARVESAAG